MAAEEDAVKVCVRVRPIIQRERGDQVNVFWKAENSTISQIDGTRSFHFDRVFDLFETTAQVYQEVAIPIIRSALHGYNGTIFAYGQTSSGKTYTMMGSPDCLGIIPQAVKEIFRIITEIPSREFLLRVSYMEIYNETVTDLLCDSRKKKPLEIREDFNRNVYVADLNEELVTCPEHVLQWIKKGEKNRHYGETKMNEHSSRSHTIFRMIVESRKSNDPGNLESSDGAVMVSHLNLVDLAGSERTSQTGAEGVRLKEGCNINRSLFILGQVIKKLSDDQPGAFINYRDSKLTRILQNSLGGNTKTVIICTITSVSFDETLSTLQFASAAKNVKNKPHVNEVLDDEALLKRYRKEITDLKKQLDTLEASSVSKAHAMANEEHAQLLAVIQQLQKEREERISNLKNVVVDSARSQEDQQLKRKRRVTWGAEKIQSTLYSAGAFPFEAGSKISANFPKRPKLSDLQTIPENDDSVCTEFSETDETARVFEDFFPDWDVGNKITLREKTAFRHSMIDLDSDAEFQNSPLLKDCSSPNHKQLEQKLSELDNRLQSEVIRKESFEKETLELKKQLEAKEEEKDELVKKLQLEITTLKDQLQNMPEVRVALGSHNELEDLDSKNLTPSQVEMNNSQSTQTDQVQENCVQEENLSSHIHDICQEQIQMLEQKIADLETSNPQTDFVESLQICEALMLEKETALSELAILRENFDSVVVENESMKQEIATMEKYLQEKNETSEFELLEKETQKEHEAQLIHEIGSLKKVVKNAELYNQELEGELENKSKVLKEQEQLIAELKKDAEVLLNKSRYSDLSISMGGDSEKIFEEVLQLKQSLGDAETVTRDAQREAAFLRSENIELKEKMDELTLHCQQREKDASSSEKQLESEKSNYKQMQSDLQKELQCAFNEINQLNGLLAGRVPKDLLSRVELDKKIADCSKQLTNALEEKNVLEKEMSYLSELKSLPSENEQLKNQVKKTSDELQLLKNEKEQSESIICDQNSKMQEQKEQIDRLIEEVRNTQAKFQQAEQQFSELTILYEDLQTRCLLTDEEIRKKDLEAEGQVKEINDLKHSLEIIEGKLSSAQQEREELVQSQQDHSSHTSSIEETLKSMVFERDNLQEELSNLSSLVETLQQQAQKQSELLKEKQDLEQKHLQLMSEMEQLQEQLNNSQLLPNIMETERSEGQLKLQELQEKITLLDQQRDDLQSKVEELTSEKNILKQDLNDNIEMSIETQDELRTTQEELKCQKQLVSDLKKQISDYAERISVQAVSYEDTTEASEANSDAIGVKKMELDEYNQSLISEMEVLKESLKSAELALATMEEEKRELMQKLDALEEDLQSVTEQRDELENTKNNLLVEKDGLKAKVEKAGKQVCELNEELQFSPVKRSHEDVIGQEKEKLLETLKAVTDERDQLKLDLHDNIEMSIETQEELRNALDELKEKSRLFEALKSQVDGSKGQTSNLEKNLEVKILDLEEKLHAAVTERDQLSEELRFLTEQKRNLEEALSATKHGLLDKETRDKEVQVLTEVLVDEEEMNVSTRLEVEAEQNILQERIDHLQQQIHIISEEREQYLQLIDTLKAENLQLVSVMQRQTEDRAAQSKETQDLASLIETLKGQLEATSQQLTLREQEAKEAAEKLRELNDTDKNISGFEMLERNLQQSSISMEKLQEERLELSDKLCGLQEELEKVTCYRENLQSKLEIVLDENASLKEVTETASSSILDLEEKLHAAVTERDQLSEELRFLTEQKRNLEALSATKHGLLDKETQDKEVQVLTEVLVDEEEMNVSTRLEVEAEQNILQERIDHLQQQIHIISEEREQYLQLIDTLKAENLQLVSVMQRQTEDRAAQSKETRDLTSLTETLKGQLEATSQQLTLREQEAKEAAEKLRELNDTDKNISGLEMLERNLQQSSISMEKLQEEKLELSDKLCALQEELEKVTCYRENLQSKLEIVLDENASLKEVTETASSSVCRKDKETQDKEVQVLTEVLVDEEEMNVSTRLEVEAEQNILQERIDHLQQQIHIISEEREQYLQLIDTLKAENLQLVSVMQRQTEDRAAQSKETQDLASLIETLKGQLEATSQQLTLREQEAKEAAEKLRELNDIDKNISELEMLEQNLQQSSISMEKLQGEKLELSDKLCGLQEELEKVTCYRENLQSKLEIVLDENASLKEIIETASSSSFTTHEVRCQELQDQGNVENDLGMQIPGSVSVQDKDTITDLMPFLEGQADLEEQLLQKTSEYEQLLQLKDKLEEDHNSLSCKVEGLTNRMTEAQTNLESLQNEKHQSEEQLLHLQQKLDDAVQDRDDLKIAHERLIDEMDQLKKNIKEKSEMDLCLQEQLLQRTSEYEQLLKMKNKLEEENSSLNCEVESLTNKMTEAKNSFESMQNEKHQTEEQLVDLKQKLNVSVQDGDDLKIAQEGLIAEIELLKRNLKENDEMVLHLKREIQQRTECQHEELEQTQHTLKNAFEQTMNDLKSTETQMEALRSEKLDTEKKLLCLQHTMEIIAQERDDLKASQENLILERDQLKEALEKNTEMMKTAGNQQEQTEVAAQTETLNNSELDQLLKDLKDMESQLASVQREKVNAEENVFTLQKHMEEIGKERDELQATLQSLQLILQSLQSEKDQLNDDLRENIEMLKTVGNQQEQTEVAAQTETLNNSELDQLLKDLKDMESQLASVQREKVNAEEKFSSLQKHMEEIGKERDELQAALQSLQSEKDKLKEDLSEHIEMCIETQEDLRSTQEELEQQIDMVSELTREISSLEQKSSSMETELSETATVLKEVTSERDDLDQCKQKLTSEVEQLLQQIRDKEVALYQAEKEKSEVSQKVFDLSSVLSSMAEEKDLLNCSKEDVEKQSVEMQNDLRRTQEELQQQNHKVETLTSEISLLEEKCSSLQKQLQEHVTLLERAVEEKEVLDQAKQKLSSDIEQLLESLKSKDTMLELTEAEKRIAAQKVIELTEEVRNLSCQIEDLQLFKENLEKEATKLREDFKQLQLQHAKFNEQETQKSAKLEELTLEVEQLKEKVTFKEAAAQQFETDKADLHRQVQQYELEVASLHQEQEQFQQLLQRVRGEKENIYTNLQDREKDNEQLKESLTTCQTELESVKKQGDESKDHVTEKVNEINAMLQQLSSLQQQLQQLHQELKNERMKNNDLNEKVDDLEKEIRVLHLLQNEPVLEEEDELAQRTESLQIKNQEFKDLMVTISSVYANQHHLLSNLSVELQDEVEAQKQSLGAIKEAMPSTHFKSFESLQTEYFKLNSQMQTLLNKFKVIYRNAAVKEEQYSLVNGYDNELCVVQKKNDELLLQCQSLEQNGTKWSESAAEELKFCELEFLNHLIFKKMDVIKRVEDGFSEVQISLNSVEGDLTEEVKSKQKFSSWLEECKGLHFDAKRFSDGIIQENRRISGLVQLLSKKLKAVVQSRIKQDTVAYLKQLDEVLQEKKEKNKELLQKRQLFAPSGDSNILEEENARLCEKLKNLQAELKKMQCRIQQLENEVTSAKADAKQKGEKASCLQERLLSSVTEAALSEMQAKVSEKEKHLETALKEIKALQEKVAQGAAPYRDEMDRLKNQVVKFEMDRIKLSKSTDQQIASLKSSLEYKEECLRKSKEQLRRSQKDVDTTICSDKNGSIPYPLTCGGGSGIVQSTTMLVLQSENASLKREIAHYRKKWHQLSRNASTIREDESKLKDRSAQTPSNLFSPLGDASQSSSEAYKQATVSPPKSDIPLSRIHSPGMHRKRAVSPSKTHKPKPQVMSPSRTHIAKPQVMSPNKTPLPKSQVMSPNKTLRHSVPASSPGKTGPNRKRAVSPFRTEGQLFSNLTESPRKKLSLPEPADLPKDKLFEWSKSLQYCPSKFFDNSTLGTLPDRSPPPSHINPSDTNPSSDPCVDADAESDPNSAIATETNEVNNWWDRADKNKNANECKTS